MICHGLGYLFILTGSNILNTIMFHRDSEFEATAAPLGCCITMIMSQRLVIHPYTCHYSRVHECTAETSVFSRDALESSQFGRSFSTQPSQDTV
jgi:hypothetical protein